MIEHKSYTYKDKYDCNYFCVTFLLEVKIQQILLGDPRCGFVT